MSSFNQLLMRFAHEGHEHSSGFSLIELAGFSIGLLFIASLLAVRFLRKDFKKKVAANLAFAVKKMHLLHNKRVPIISVALIVLITGIVIAASKSHGVDVLTPRGSIASQERNLIIFTVGLGLLVILPVFYMTFLFAWKYRAGNNKSKYTPEWDGNLKLEAVWWLIPLLIITVLAVVTWKTSHSLDPFKPLISDKKPVTVQVISLDWKWLFLYPEEGVASVNYFRFPEDTPVNFEITSDAPMNSFWIPQLGGQIYAMSGMTTKLHLIADEKGKYDGSSANISGEGFAGMTFTAEATSDTDFESWISDSRRAEVLDRTKYDNLVKPTKNEPAKSFKLVESGLFDTVVSKYTEPGNKTESHSGEGHH